MAVVQKVLVVMVVALLVSAAAGWIGYAYGVREGQAQAEIAFEAYLAERLTQSVGTAQSGLPTGGQGGVPLGAAMSGVTGTVEGVDGGALMVKGSDGASVKVLVTDNTTISKTSQVAAQDLAAGEVVTVLGQKDGDGNLVARAIQVGQGGLGGMPGGAGFNQGRGNTP